MANYKYENGKYYRQSSNGTWFEVTKDEDGKFTWIQPDGQRVYDSKGVVNTRTSLLGVPVFTGSGGIKWVDPEYQLVAQAEANRNKPVDPSENVLNDLTFGAFTSVPKAIYVGGKALVNGGINLFKSLSEKGAKETAKKVATKATEAVIREIPRVGVSVGTGTIVDATSNWLTGKTWGENISNKLSRRYGFQVPTIVGDFTNPGYYAGYNLMDRAIRRASFNQITPLAYHDGIAPLTKFQEGIEIIKDIPKQIFDIRPIKKPKWRQRFEQSKKDLEMPISTENMLNNREDALRLVFGQPQKYNTYIKNSDGTYSYNLETLSKQNNPYLHREGYQVSPSGEISPRYTYEPLQQKGMYGDALGYNGGFINQTEKDGLLHLVDDFDVQPFKDNYRLPSFKGAKTMHKYLPDLEIFNAFGGKPFELKMTIPKYEDPYVSFTM